MSMLVARDALFKALHTSHLRAIGFSLRGGRSERRNGQFTQALRICSHSWNNAESAAFDIDVVVAHAEYNPHRSFGCKVGTGVRDDTLLEISLSRLAAGGQPFWTFDAGSDLEKVADEVHVATRRVALPFLQRADTLEGVASIYEELDNVRRYKGWSWVLKKLGQDRSAAELIQRAADAAPHDVARKHALAWRDTLFPATASN